MNQRMPYLDKFEKEEHPMKMHGATFLFLPVILTLLVSCAESSPNVRYGDATAVEAVNTDFGSTDLQMIAEKMTTSLLESKIIGDDRPVIWVGHVKNNTSEHIDTKSIVDKIQTTIIKSGRARFAASDLTNDVLDQMDYQNSGLVDPRSAQQYGKQVGAKYLLGGEIVSIVKTAGRTKDVYYKITLKLVDLKTNIIEWADEKEIRKDATRG